LESQFITNIGECIGGDEAIVWTETTHPIDNPDDQWRTLNSILNLKKVEGPRRPGVWKTRKDDGSMEISISKTKGKNTPKLNKDFRKRKKTIP